MPNLSQNHGTPFSASNAGTTTADATFSGTNVQLLITDIAASSSGTAGTWALYAGSGTTPLWQGAGTVNYQFSEPIRVTGGQSVSFKVNGTTATYGNVSGYYL